MLGDQLVAKFLQVPEVREGLEAVKQEAAKARAEALVDTMQ